MSVHKYSFINAKKRFYLSRLLFIVLLTFSLLCNAKTLTAKSWLLSDINGTIISSQNVNEILPIASITKLITAIVVIDAKQDLTEVLTLTTELKDKLPRKNQKTTRKDLIEMALVSSDNRAALTLCQNYIGGLNACIEAINNKAIEIGMYNTKIVEPTGLDKDNVSTAKDLMLLVKETRNYPLISLSKQYRTKVLINDKWVDYTNTNPLTEKHTNIQISKTGWTFPAGGCIVMLTDDKILVILGSRSTRTRIQEAEQILNLK